MSYQTFYRKYRPSDLDDVAGQQSIVKIIKNSLKLNRISHAYLFCGPRGTGKTTMAKILAKNINCLDIQDGMACGKCKNCFSILNGNCPDIIEMDAASNNGVDEIREIKNKVALVPTELKYKVYIIDEVHMLSIGAFNALLKTLEEPPEHVIFILATTDLHKVPITIISRCQCLDFHRITEKEIVKRLNQIVDSENIEIDEDVLSSIANLSDGGLRDAIGMLDKLVSYSDGNITLSDFEELNGIVSLTDKKEFLKLVEKNKIKEIIEFINKIYNSGKDLIIFSQDLMILCRNLIVDYYSYENAEFDVDFLLAFVENLNELSKALRDANNIRIIFETKILSFMNQMNIGKSVATFQNEKSFSNVLENKNSNNNESVVKVAVEENKNEISESNVQTENSDFERRNSILINNCFVSASKKKLLEVKEKWERLSDYALDSQFGAVACYLSDSTVRAAGEHEIIVTFDYESVVTRGMSFGDKVDKLLQKIFNDQYYVAYLTVEQWNKEKDKYIENKNNGYQYIYQKLEILNEKNEENFQEEEKNEFLSNGSSIIDEAIKLFGESVVSVNE